ncbi:MAG: glycoside hydrolase family 43 protein [Clostridia bacterium]|nr:glycoside hydrolase family 43 protein [Clostridia bacterium]
MKPKRFSLPFLLLALLLLFSSCRSGDPGRETSGSETLPEPEETAELILLENKDPINASYIKNPYSSITKIGDPYILYAGGAYYLYATSGMKCWKSTDLKSWSSVGQVYDYAACKFGDQKFWAPECHEYQGKYYLVFSAQSSKTNLHSIGIAVADKPEGPFTDLLPEGAPLFSPGYSVIDASLFFDDDGKCYLVYSKDCSTNKVNGKKTSQSCAIELTSDLRTTVGEPVILSTPTEDWEKKSGNTLWNEGPCIFKHDGTYYLMFSANSYSKATYCVGYAMAKNVLGPYTKPANNPLIETDGGKISGPGHNNYFLSPDGTEIYTVYHIHTDPANPSGDRTPCIDRLVFDEDGLLYANGPSAWAQPVPSGTSNYCKLTDGVSVSVAGIDGKTAGRLLDGRTGSPYLMLTEENTATVTLETPTALSQLWVYPGDKDALRPLSFSVTVNGTYRFENVAFSSKANSPAVLYLGALPKGTLIETLEITATPQDGKQTCALSELVLQYKKAK